MRRREFITLLGGGGSVAARRACAQQADEVRRIGVLVNAAADDPEAQTSIAAFIAGPATTGLERRPQSADRLSRGGWRRRTDASVC